MEYFNKLKKSARSVPWYVWAAGLLLPGGMIAIGTYTAIKATRKAKTDQTLREYMDSIIKEGEENDRSKDRR